MFLAIIIIIIVVTDDRQRPLVRQTRGIRMCPPGMSGEQCFYSQLAMFVRQHNSFTDPVALRNIGKRNGGNTDNAFLGNSMDYLEPQYEFDYQYDMPEFRQDENIPSFDFGKNRNMMPSVRDYADAYNPGSVLGNILKSPDLLSQLQNILSTPPRESQLDESSSLNQPKSKRQVICPPGMPRVACYDNALAFYIQLMRTMNHKRFV